MLIVIARIVAIPGREEAVRDALLALVEPTRAEAGCITYDLHCDRSDPALFYFYEAWESEAHLDAHLASEHLARFGAMADELVAEPVAIHRMDRVEP